MCHRLRRAAAATPRGCSIRSSRIERALDRRGSGGQRDRYGRACGDDDERDRGVFQGSYSYLLQDEYGQVLPAHSISAGLDYPGIGPEHAYLKDTGRAEYVPATDQEALDALQLLSRTEGIIPALESAHAVAYAAKLAPNSRLIRSSS